MRTRLLRRLRRKANNLFYIDVLENSFVGVIYRVVRRGFIEQYLGDFTTKMKAEAMLEFFKKEYIRNEVEILRFYEKDVH